MLYAIAAVDRKKYIAKRERESLEARRNQVDVAAAAVHAVHAVRAGKFNTYILYVQQMF